MEASDRTVSITPQPDTSATLNVGMILALERPTFVSLLVKYRRLEVLKFSERVYTLLNEINRRKQNWDISRQL
jgi:hypothetical protein